MKTLPIIALTLSALTIFSCSKSEGGGKKGKLDPSAKVYIVPAAGVPLQASTKAETDGQVHLTAKEIVQTAENIVMTAGSIGVADWNRDIPNSRFIVGSNWVITQDGDLETDFIESRDYIFVTLNDDLRPEDTLAYIPNAVMIKAESDIKAAFSAGKYTDCYTLLQTAFQFTPITGAEFKALKDQGKN